MTNQKRQNDNEEILGYECMTPNCSIVTQHLLDFCPMCGKKDWRAIVNRKPIEIKENPQPNDILDEWGCIREEYMIGEGEFKVYQEDANGKKKKGFEIRYSNSSFQKDQTGAVARVRIIDKENDTYIEKISYTDTGTVIRDCGEKLSEHQGHGSAKGTQENAD